MLSSDEGIMELNWEDKNFYKETVLKIESMGLDRMKVQGSDMSEADFFAGALSAMTALGLQPHKYPSRWTIGLMFNAWSLRDQL